MAKNNRTADRVQAMLNLIGGDDVLDMLMDGRAKLTVEIVCRLKSTTSLAVPGNTINPHDFFKTRKGLWTSSDFNDFILSGAAKKKMSAEEKTIGYADLAQTANDAEIGSELPEGHVFEDVDTFLVHLATLIDSQWGGKRGTLLNNGYANISYVKVNGEIFAVHVSWYADDRSGAATPIAPMTIGGVLVIGHSRQLLLRLSPFSPLNFETVSQTVSIPRTLRAPEGFCV